VGVEGGVDLTSRGRFRERGGRFRERGGRFRERGGRFSNPLRKGPRFVRNICFIGMQLELP
jgi:hypothetical protein